MLGPYDTEAQAATDIRPLLAEHPGRGETPRQARALLTDALADAGLAMGAYDHRIADWLAGWEPATVQVIADWIRRAHDPNRNPEQETK